MHRRLGLNGATTGPADLTLDLQAAREAGLGALELRDTKLQRYLQAGGSLETLRQMLAQAGVEPASINAVEHATPASQADQQAVLERCRTLCRWAHALGCPLVVAVAGPRGELAPQEATERTVQTLRSMAAIARQHGVRIGFEFLGFPGMSVRTLEEARSVVEAVGDPAVGLVLDTFHFHAGGSTPGMLQGLDVSRLFMVHLNDAEDRPPSELTDGHRLLPGDGVIPLAELVAALETLGYRGVYSVELFRPEYWEWEPKHLAREAHRRLQRLLEQAR